jgi:hypothetical protein
MLKEIDFSPSAGRESLWTTGKKEGFSKAHCDSVEILTKKPRWRRYWGGTSNFQKLRFFKKNFGKNSKVAAESKMADFRIFYFQKNCLKSTSTHFLIRLTILY